MKKLQVQKIIESLCNKNKLLYTKVGKNVFTIYNFDKSYIGFIENMFATQTMAKTIYINLPKEIEQIFGFGFDEYKKDFNFSIWLVNNGKHYI